jgi:hypothetical protein
MDYKENVEILWWVNEFIIPPTCFGKLGEI